MIELPTKGIALSVNKHNCDLNVICDWIEACVMLGGDELSQADIVDILMEEELYQEQHFASQFIGNVWYELDRRSKLCSTSYCIEVDQQWVKTITNWDQKPAHLFCLLLSLARKYDWWRKQFGNDYTIQGELFEKLAHEALVAIAPGWETHLTGWSRSNPAGFFKTAEDIAEIIGNGIVNTGLWDPNSAGDMGLDLFLYRPFPDNRKGFPYMLIQCASGADWKHKRQTPNLDVWRNLINPPTPPMRGFAVPFCLSETEFWQSSVACSGLLIDRCRLLGAAYLNENWVSDTVKQEILEWAAPRIQGLIDKSS